MTYLVTTLFISNEANLEGATERFYSRLQKCAQLAKIHFSSADPQEMNNELDLDDLLRQRSYEKPDEDLSQYQLYAFFTVCTPNTEDAVDDVARTLLMEEADTAVDQFPSTVDLTVLTATPVLSGGA